MFEPARPLSELTAASSSSPPGSPGTTPNPFWLDGDAVMCACPECGAPTSVRLWLMIADCWQCGCSLELSEVEERQVRELLAQRHAPVPDRAVTGVTLPIAAPVVSEPARPAVATAVPALAGDVTASVPPIREPAPSGRLSNMPQRWLRSLVRETPAWLVSLIVHLLLLTLLALIRLEEDDARAITLAINVSRNVREGGENLIAARQDETKFNLPLPEDADLTSDRERKALELAAEDARELQLDPDSPQPQLPDLRDVKRRVGDTGDIRAALAARDPRIRVEMVRREGGTTLTEAAVARGLQWIARQQHEDGAWSLRGYDGGYGIESRAAGTALALLSFLGAGQTHLVGIYQPQVSAGLRWLLEHQADNGDLRADSDRQAGMYAHGQAAIALCEAYALTGDEKLREPAQKALAFIAAAQYSDGGWRYTPEEPASVPGGDTSVVGWQLMALQSGRAGRFAVPQHTLELAGQFLDRVQSDAGARYAYRPGEQGTPTMTAEALLCRLYLGWTRDEGALREAVEYLAVDHPPSPNDWNIYYWYYGTQVLHHLGGDLWDDWNQRMRDVLVFSQETGGRHAGSWPPRGPFADSGGRLYVTALAVCTLEVYYRHLPLFRPLELD